MDIIIFSGQSNMQGQTEKLLDGSPVAGCLEYHYIGDEFVPLADPIGETIRKDGTAGYTLSQDNFNKETLGAWLDAHALASASYGFSSMVPSFCRAYGKPAIAIHAAKGSTVIGQWLPGGDSHETWAKKIKAGIQKAKEQFEIGHIYLAWLQGESDAILGRSEEEYLADLIALKNFAKEQFGVEKFGIIQVGDFTNDDRDAEIRNAQAKAPEVDGDFVMLTTIANTLIHDPKYQNPNVGGHYNAEAQALMGKLAGEALSKL